jgi:propionyl-CoA carboxylase alpha chain
VTELITGIDLVEQMIRVAYGEKLPFKQKDIGIYGWAMESRLYAEDPYRGFLPSIGRLTRYRPPAERAEAEIAVRNDTGVYEGGEISVFYDPMIAKLCTWAPTRLAAIEAMRDALDGFEVEGIGHNLPFLAAVMDHPKFVSGNITTAFIEEEYPEGFEGVNPDDATLQRLAAVAAHMKMLNEARAVQISGAMPNHKRRVEPDWIVKIGSTSIPVHIEETGASTEVTFSDGTHFEVVSNWTLGDRLFEGTVGDAPMIVKTEFVRGGTRLRYRGADLKVVVQTPRQAELALLMPKKMPPDTSKLLLCPMPGLVVKVDVTVGDEVQDGQALCTVEAMKMENILRAERSGIVSRVNASAGDILAVDEVIMEFE